MISRFEKNTQFVRELSDQDGLYLFEVKAEGKKPGETVEYLYLRKGTFPNGQQALETTLYRTEYEDDFPISGVNIAVYREANGTWEEII